MPEPLSTEKRQEREQRIREQQASGLSVLRWCRENNVNYDSMLYWRKQLGVAPPIKRSSFKEITPSSDPSEITIEYQRVQLHLPKNLSPTVLMHYLRVLKGGP